jgi:hypothetical protein
MRVPPLHSLRVARLDFYESAKAFLQIVRSAMPSTKCIRARYLIGETTESNSYNECLTIEADDQILYLRGLGMARGDSSKLTQEGAAEFYWSMLIEHLQSR